MMAEAPRLEVSKLQCGYGNTPVLHDITFDVRPGEVCCILGPNGIGKTTLFKTVLGSLPALGGTVTFEGESMDGMSQVERAKRIGYVPQAHTPPFPFTVLDVVEMGRTSHVSTFSSPSKEDRMIALEALNTFGIAHLHDRVYTQVSGGERQMVLIARALAQQASFMIMDEPTSALDFGNQVKVLGHVRALADEGMSILMTTHAPDQVFMCADRVLVIDETRHAIHGKPNELLNDELLSRIYDVRAHVVDVSAGRASSRVVLPELAQRE